MAQHILVCAQDSVLAKKVRFLLARDECEVEILSKPSQLERRLADGNIALLILSRSLDGEDAIEMIARFDPSLMIPPTIVLGGQPTITADFITVIPDPIDTQAIYRIASEALAYQVVHQEIAQISDEDQTQMGIPRPQPDEPLTQTTQNPVQSSTFATSIDEAIAESHDEEISFTDVTGLDEIAGKLDLLESADAMLNDAFDIDDPPPSPGQSAPPPPAMKRTVTAQTPKQEPQVLGGLLEPARFAKVLYQCWSKQATGALIVARDHETLTIYFEAGAPVHVESSIPGDQLGRALVARGRITDAQYSDGAKRAIERGLKLGQALIELAFFTNPELGRELGTNAREQIVGCFAARQGAFEFDPKRKSPTEERPYSISVGHIIAEGIRSHADEGVLREIIGDIDAKYFKINRTIDELGKKFPLDEKDIAFLEFSGRAYNVADASEVSGLEINGAHKLLSILMTCEEVSDFTPGVKEFEARISEERARAKDLESKARASVPPEVPKLPREPLFDKRSNDRVERADRIGGGDSPFDKRMDPPLGSRMERDERRDAGGGRSSGGGGRSTLDDLRQATGGTSSPAASGGRGLTDRSTADDPFGTPMRKMQSSSYDASPPPASLAPQVPPMPPRDNPPPPPPPSTSYSSPPSNGDAQVPPMPVPGNGELGMVPRPLVYAKPLPRGSDGTPLETQERTLSREHFQRGVTLLGQGNFASAEEAFRDAVALCSEEHVYLIGLARAIYYNPGYRADGKVPVLKAIVGRAEQLAPDDNRVATLSTWIQHAESQLRPS